MTSSLFPCGKRRYIPVYGYASSSVFQARAGSDGYVRNAPANSGWMRRVLAALFRRHRRLLKRTSNLMSRAGARSCRAWIRSCGARLLQIPPQHSDSTFVRA